MPRTTQETDLAIAFKRFAEILAEELGEAPIEWPTEVVEMDKENAS